LPSTAAVAENLHGVRYAVFVAITVIRLGGAVLATVERADDSVLFGLSDRGVAALEPGAPLDEAKQAMT
jgi:hypothetical protein